MKIITNKFERTCVRCKMNTEVGEKVAIEGFGVAHLDSDCTYKLKISKQAHPAYKG
jgi:hypothetical protein